MRNIGREKNIRFPIWKVVKIGVEERRTIELLQEAFTKTNTYDISIEAKNLLTQPSFTISQVEKKINLVKVLVSELGFNKSTKISKIFKRAHAIGLGLCPAEVGPELRLQYCLQPPGETIQIGMNPIRDSDDDPLVFRVMRHIDPGSDYLLSWNYGHGNNYLHCYDYLVFVPDY